MRAGQFFEMAPCNAVNWLADPGMALLMSVHIYQSNGAVGVNIAEASEYQHCSD
jgi:hypothetical protein